MHVCVCINEYCFLHQLKSEVKEFKIKYTQYLSSLVLRPYPSFLMQH